MSGNYVYVIRYREHDHKIGFSVRPDQRFSALRAQTSASRIIRTWHRPDGDAQRVEGIAHRLLREWRLPIPRQVERFGLSEIAACMAVDLAVRIAEDEAHPRDFAPAPVPPPPPSVAIEPPRPRERPPERDQYGPPADLAPPMYGPPPPVRIGYALCRSDDDVAKNKAALIEVGVEEARIYMDMGRRRGPGMVAARKACRTGDILVLVKTTADPQLRAVMAEKGATWMEIAA